MSQQNQKTPSTNLQKSKHKKQLQQTKKQKTNCNYIFLQLCVHSNVDLVNFIIRCNNNLERENVLCKKILNKHAHINVYMFFVNQFQSLNFMKVNVEKVLSSSILLMIWTMNLNFHHQLEKKKFVNPKYPLKMAQKPMNQMYRVFSM